jgi:hypothetical protein
MITHFNDLSISRRLISRALIKFSSQSKSAYWREDCFFVAILGYSAAVALIDPDS